MKLKLIILLMTVLSCLVINAQTAVKRDANGNFIQVKATRDSAKAKPTGNTYTDSKGKVYSVYVSVNGKYYIIRTSRNGNDYKQYLKLD